MNATRLSRDEFATALHQGRGAALIHAMEFGLAGIEDLVVESCLENSAYDAQCEDARARWLYRMFKDAPQREIVSRAIVGALGEPYEHFSMEQICQLAGLLACDGDARAARALRNFVLGQEFKSDEFPYGGSALVMIDGMDAVVELARRSGRILLTDPDAMVDDLESLTEHVVCHDEALATLVRRASSDLEIRAYVDMLQANSASCALDLAKSPALREKERRERTGSLAEIRTSARSEKNQGRGKFIGFGRWASAEDLEVVMHDLLAATSAEVCMRLLWVFRNRAMPRLDARIWEMAGSDNPRLRSAALAALSRLADPEVGAFARAQLQSSGGIPIEREVIELFAKNYLAGDEALLLRALKKFGDSDDAAHSYGFGIMRVAEEIHAPAIASLLEWTYHTNPCSLCRGSAVVHLFKMSCVPRDIADECYFDADSDSQAVGRALRLETRPHSPDA